MTKPAKLIREDRPLDAEDIPFQPLLKRAVVGKLDRASLHKPQGPDSGFNSIIGKLPADDGLSEEEFIALVEEIS
jgi:hypothetical protein